MESGFILDPPGKISDWIKLSDVAEYLREQIKVNDDAENKEEAEELAEYIREGWSEIAKHAEGLRIKVKVLARHKVLELEENARSYNEKHPIRIASLKSNGEIMRAGLSAIDGIKDMAGLKFGSEEFFLTLENSKLDSLLANAIMKYNQLGPEERAGFFTQGQVA